MRPAHPGEKVLVLLDPAQNNGSSVAVAWVTRCWERPTAHAGIASQTVNVRVLTDTGEMPLFLPSIMLFEGRPRPEDLAQMLPHNPMGYRTVAFRADTLDF